MSHQQEDSVSTYESSSSLGLDCFSENFLSQKGNEFFCEIDEEYILDRFNLTGISSEVSHFQLALEMLTDNLKRPLDSEMQLQVEDSARHLYGLIHARYIVTPRGLTRMVDKFMSSDFGICPRAMCQEQSVLPIGLSDVCHTSRVQLYCPKCEDVYAPKSSRHLRIDGAYFGTSFPHLLLATNSHLIPAKASLRYVPRIFGFRIEDHSTTHRRQDELRKSLPTAKVQTK